MEEKLPERVRPSYFPGPTGWWAGGYKEYMNFGGPFQSKEDAIECGREYRDADPFYILHASVHGWSAPDATSVMDGWVDGADELFYGDGFPGFDNADGKRAALLEREAENDLQAVLNEWAKRHLAMLPNGTAFNGTSDGEWIFFAWGDPIV